MATIIVKRDISGIACRFFMLQQEDSYPNGAEYQVVLNWLTEVRTRLGCC